MADTAFDVIPSIDLLGGKCVRLRQGDYNDVTEFGDDPLDIALQFQAAGLKRLHVVDLDGAKARAVKHWDVLERLGRETNLRIDFSGGITSLADVEHALRLGAGQVAIGSLAVHQSELFIEMLKQFGAQALILSADVRDGIVKVAGWTEATTLTLEGLVTRFEPHGLQWLMCTDINRDGMLEGPNLDLYRHLAVAFPTLHVLASGGISTVSDVHAIKKLGLAGAVIGRALLEGDLDAAALEAFQS
jgi:phosphoribosylformimino-5-aminoimidazole carboxamide ribotide isomerase